MKAESASREFAALFPEVYRRYHRRVSPADYRMTAESIAVVQHLADSGPLTVSEAAQHMNRSQAAMSELIARLVRRGLLARVRDERDRRRTLVWLTDEGRAALESARSVLSPDLLEQAFRAMKSIERKQLIAGMRLLIDKATGIGEKRK